MQRAPPHEEQRRSDVGAAPQHLKCTQHPATQQQHPDEDHNLEMLCCSVGRHRLGPTLVSHGCHSSEHQPGGLSITPALEVSV